MKKKISFHENVCLIETKQRLSISVQYTNSIGRTSRNIFRCLWQQEKSYNENLMKNDQDTQNCM